MPEGDTIHRAAATLRSVLVGRELIRLEAPRLVRPMPPAGSSVTSVTARGKHLLVHFDTDEVLHTHMRMSGSWHTYRTGQRWRAAAARMRVVLGDGDVEAVCFDAPVVELLDEAALVRHPRLSRLGPDLVTEDDAVPRGLDRLARLGLGSRPVVEVLMDQRVTAGIGNVYANEVAFLAGVDPRRRAADVVRDDFERMLAEGARLLRANLARSRRTTVPGRRPGALWVYDRTGRPCRRCGTTIRGDRVGDGARPTHWCPTCQPPESAPTTATVALHPDPD